MKNIKYTVVIHGFFRNGPPGLSNNAKNLFKAIKGNYQVSRNNINYKNLIFKNNLRYRSNYERTKISNIFIHIFCLQPMHTTKIINKIKNKNKDNCKNYFIGYWAWELATWPKQWQNCFEVIDEVWCPSKFVYDAIPICYKEKRKFIVYPGFDLNIKRKKIHSEKISKFIFSYDSRSKHERKNPQGVLYSFWNAFGFPFENNHDFYNADVKLTIKTISSKLSNGLKEVNQLIEADSRISFINKKLAYSEVIELYKAHDCFISLHKSEGFGYGIAENLLLGNEIITTNYSGSKDLCSESNSFLVGYVKEFVGNSYPHSNYDSIWANPKINEASKIMKNIVKNNIRRNSRGPLINLSQETLQKKVMERLKDIEQLEI